MFDINFEIVVGEHIKLEGGWVNHPNDPGGETYKGISRRFNPSWLGWHIIDVLKSKPGFPESLDSNEELHEAVKEYYYHAYWTPMKLEQIKDLEICKEMFDIGAGPNGPNAAAKILQGALILLKQEIGTIDGQIGTKTLNAVNNYAHPGDLVKLLNCLQFCHLLVGNNNVDETIEMARDRLPQLKSFMRGWLKRIAI